MPSPQTTSQRTTERRIISAREVAAILGAGVSTFHAKRKKLESRGFPPRNELLGGWDLLAIHQWLDEQSGLAMDDAEHDDPWGNA